MINRKLAEELHKPIIRKFEKRKVHSSFYLEDTQTISKFKKGLHFYYLLLTFVVNMHG